jgi:GH25 family lysozyme M1 (1,4-beta-N-acetylmuramidase)
MKALILVPLVFVLAQCSTAPSVPHNSSPMAYNGAMPQIINVSSYDPKERQRSGRGFSENDVSSLRANGASGLIARAGKGGNLDDKCAAFIASADRASMLPGLYYRVQKHRSPVTQADQFVDRAISLSKSRNWRAPALLLCGDYDGDLTLEAILAFMDRVEARTGIVPVAYLENNLQLKIKTRAASAETRNRLRRAPYWLALYSHESRDNVFPAPENPNGLVDQYRIWPQWTMWQYGGVDWEGGRSKPKVYAHDKYHFSTYFGDLDRPTERNVFNGSMSDLNRFWQKHGLKL